MIKKSQENQQCDILVFILMHSEHVIYVIFSIDAEFGMYII